MRLLQCERQFNSLGLRTVGFILIGAELKTRPTGQNDKKTVLSVNQASNFPSDNVRHEGRVSSSIAHNNPQKEAE